MKHPETELLDWLDGTLTPRRAAQINNHLVGCTKCQATIERLSMLEHRLQTSPRLLPPRDFNAQVQRRIALLPPQPIRIRWTTPVTMSILSLLVMLPSLATILHWLSRWSIDLRRLVEPETWLPRLAQLSSELEATLVVGLCALTLACLLVVVQTLSVRLPLRSAAHHKAL